VLRALVVCGCSRAVVMAAEANARELEGLLALAGTRFYLLLYWYKGTNTDAGLDCACRALPVQTYRY
jgi:hypothetical protein